MKDYAIGLISSNYATDELDLLVKERNISTIPYAGRYRLVDFPLSNMVNSGLRTIGIITPYTYRSLIDHIGAGRNWFLDRSNGGLFILPGTIFGISNTKARFLLRDINRNSIFMRRTPAPYVLITATSTVYNYDYNELIESHKNSGADITILTHTAYEDDANLSHAIINNERVVALQSGVKKGDETFIDCFVINTNTLFDIINTYAAVDYQDLFEAIQNDFNRYYIRAHHFNGYCQSFFTVKQYFENSMNLLDIEVYRELFRSDRPIMTKIHGTIPTKYETGCSVINSLVQEGSNISGSIENSVIFRNVNVKKGAKIKNCVIMQSCTIEENTVLENAIIDRNNIITKGSTIKGSKQNPIILEKKTEYKR